MSAAAPPVGRGGKQGASVDAWLDWQLTLHASEIELGLERIVEVARRMEVLPAAGRNVVIAGTNGKGSCAALVSSLLGDHGRVGTYTSPHLWRYNERIRIDGVAVEDADLCTAFDAVEQARADTPLTYFEYGTLAALELFARYRVDFRVLEVGLGGRLDAVNIIDADVALITNIGLDHIDWLGSDREAIGFEKAGVMRAGRPAVCADRDMPKSIADYAETIGAPLARIGRDFDIVADSGEWRWHDLFRQLAIPVDTRVLADNLAAALAVYATLFEAVPSSDNLARACAAQGALSGRRERIDGALPIIYDVAHNAEAVAVLARDLSEHPASGRTHLVLGMLADKPVETVGSLLDGVVDHVYLAGLEHLSARGLSAAGLAQRLAPALSVARTPRCFDTPRDALSAALEAGEPGDRIVVCGSFLTVANSREPSFS